MYTALFIAASLLILVYFKVANFRRFLLCLAFLLGIGVSSCLSHVYGKHGSIFIVCLIIPLAAVIITNFAYLAFTDRKKLLVELAVLAGLAGTAWLLYLYAPVSLWMVLGVVTVFIIMCRGGGHSAYATEENKSDDSLCDGVVKTELIHGACEVPFDEAYIFSKLF